jgi:hypothetical protein
MSCVWSFSFQPRGFLPDCHPRRDFPHQVGNKILNFLKCQKSHGSNSRTQHITRQLWYWLLSERLQERFARKNPWVETCRADVPSFPRSLWQVLICSGAKNVHLGGRHVPYQKGVFHPPQGPLFPRGVQTKHRSCVKFKLTQIPAKPPCLMLPTACGNGLQALSSR